MIKRYSNFGLTIHPRYEGESIDWKSLSKEEISSTLSRLGFIIPSELVSLMRSVRIPANSRKSKTGVKKYYFSKVKNFGGQLELGAENGVPHYQLWLEFSPQCGKMNLLQYFSEKIYGVERSEQISVLVLGTEFSDYKNYCSKEDRANLPGSYSNSIENSDFFSYLEEEPEAALLIRNPFTYQRYVFQLLKEARIQRKIYWFIDLWGSAGKSLLTDVLTYDNRTKSVFVGIDYGRAFKMNLAEAIEDFIQKNSCEPETIILDIPRAEESGHLHQIYGALEEVQNGRINARFGSKSLSFRIDRNIRILVFSNCPPDLNQMSLDRWKIFALFECVSGKDVLIQEAKVSPQLVRYGEGIVTWRHQIETIFLNNLDVIKDSDKILKFSFLCNFMMMKMLQENDSTVKPGVLISLGPERTAMATQAPESIKVLILKNSTLKKSTSIKNPFKHLD